MRRGKDDNLDLSASKTVSIVNNSSAKLVDMLVHVITLHSLHDNWYLFPSATSFYLKLKNHIVLTNI
eukprot:c28712_g2_i2 orf=644-844(+)